MSDLPGQSSSLSMPLVPGSLVLDGRYRVERLLGRGGMGAVYLVTHMQLSEPRALKIIRTDVLQEDAVRARFRREARVQSRVRHPNVVTVYDFGEDPNGDTWLLLEYVDGDPLDALIERDAPLPAEQVAALLNGLCRGVAAAHASGIIHRDLKPANILVERDAQGGGQAKVLDFGIAKPLLIDANSTVTSNLTSTNMLVGTPTYISPDQLIEGPDQPLDTRSDIYSLGLIAIEMLTGKRPTRSGSFVEMMQRTLRPLPSLAELTGGQRWPEALEHAIRRATAIDRDERTPDAAMFADEFSAAVVESGLGRASHVFPQWAPRSVQVMAESEVARRRGQRASFAVAAIAVSAALVLYYRGSRPVATSGPPALTLPITPPANAAPKPNARSDAPSSVTVVPPRGARGAVASKPANGVATIDSSATQQGALQQFLSESNAATEDEGTLRQRVRDADAFMSRARTRFDSVALGFVALESELLLSRDEPACTRLKSLLPRSDGTRFARGIRLYADSLGC